MSSRLPPSTARPLYQEKQFVVDRSNSMTNVADASTHTVRRSYADSITGYDLRRLLYYKDVLPNWYLCHGDYPSWEGLHATSDAIATYEKGAFCCVKKLLVVQLYKQRRSQKRANVFLSRKDAHTPLNNGRSGAAQHTPAGVQGMTPAGVQGMRPSERLAALATRRQAGVEVSPGTTVPR